DVALGLGPGVPAHGVAQAAAVQVAAGKVDAPVAARLAGLAGRGRERRPRQGHVLERETENLDDPSRMKAEYWADGPHSEFPPGHWALFAQAMSRKRGDSLEDDAKLF